MQTSNIQPRSRRAPNLSRSLVQEQLLTPAEKRQVRNMIQSMVVNEIEDKVTYVSGDAAGVSNSGTVISLTTNLTRADIAVNGFTGNLLKPTLLKCKYTWSSDQAFSSCRFLAFQFLDSATPVTSGLLQFVTGALPPHSPILWTNIHKIKVLYDHTHTLKLRNTTGTDAKSFEFTIPGERMSTLQFASGTLQPQMNGLYVLAITDDSIVSYPGLTYVTELRYTDA